LNSLRTYQVEHAAIEAFELFMVPIGPDGEGKPYGLSGDFPLSINALLMTWSAFFPTPWSLRSSDSLLPES
jgi:hypothetical protein